MKISILYGSQTGTAEDVSKRIGWEAKRRSFEIRINSLDDYHFAHLPTEELVVFVCSTMGQGEEPDNMKKFWKFLLRKNLPLESLSGVNYSVIGLGDSSYSKYNFVAKKLYKRLKQLGGYPVTDLILGDDQHELGPDAEIDPWMESFWDAACKILNIETPIRNNSILSPSFKIDFGSQADCIFDPMPSLHSAPVSLNKRMTSEDHFQDVRHLGFDISNTDLKYCQGEVAIIMPRNSTENVRDFLEILNLDPKLSFTISLNDLGVTLPPCFERPCTVQDCVESYWDIQSVPRRSFFELVWHFSRSELEIEKLQEFASAKGQEELYNYCNRPRRSIVEVLGDFPGTTPHIPFEYLFELIPPIKPRLFTISSSPMKYPYEIQLLVAVVSYTTRLRKLRKGLCSTYLSEVLVGDKVKIGVRNGTFNFPRIETPVIMIGPGTGCSPFRAFVQERSAIGGSGCYLFFGCRNENGDFLCRDEWKAFENEGVLKLVVAFSRDQEDKIYVQHKIIEEKEMLWELIDTKMAWVMIAGNAKQMPQGVQEALCEVFALCGGMDETEAKTYLKSLEKSQRLQFEVWA